MKRLRVVATNREFVAKAWAPFSQNSLQIIWQIKQSTITYVHKVVYKRVPQPGVESIKT